MRKILFYSIVFMTLSIPARSEQLLGVGDSVMQGVGGDPVQTLGTYLSMTYYNGAVPASCISDTSSGLAALLSAHTPTRVYNNAGINDVRTWADECHSPLNTWLTYYSTIKTATEGAGSTLYALQITPDKLCDYDSTNDASGTIKLWNAYLEEWCYENNVPLCPTYQDMSVNTPATSSTTDDALNNTSDGIHPNATGSGIMGYLMVQSAVPSLSRDWGDAAYPTFGHESWSWWIITGTGEITGGSTDGVTGKNDGGTLSLSQDAYGVSDVLSIETANEIKISATLTQGAGAIYYRTDDENFYRANNSISWIEYTEPFTTTDNFIQIMILNSSATTALIDEVTIDWIPLVPQPSLTSGYSGTASWQ